MSYSVANINPIPIAFFECTGLFTEKEKDDLKSTNLLRAPNHPGLFVSESYQVLKDLSLTRLENILLQCVDTYIKEVLEADISVRCVGSWLTKNNKDSYHPDHFHPNSLISTVAYFSDDTKQTSGITFKSGGLQNVFNTKLIKFTKIQRNQYNGGTLNVYPSFDNVIVFPSHLQHQGLPATEDNRYMLGANFFPTGEFGNSTSKDFLMLS